MSTAVSVFHGQFGRASLYFLDKPIIRHAHGDGHLIFHVKGPDQFLSIGDARHSISCERGVAVNPWEPHNYEPAGTIGSYMLVIYIKPAWFGGQYAQSGRRWRFGRAQIEVTARISGCIDRAVSLLLAGGSSSLFEGSLFDLVSEAFAQSSERLPSAAAAETTPARISDYRVRKSIDILQQNLCSEIDLDRVAGEAGLSRPHFFKLFRDHLGVSPKLFWNSMRMDHAIGELTATTKSVTEISLDMGFSSPCSFSRFFASNVGIAPTDYRRAARILHA
jgi:AraC-like DNA-binding protein